MDKLKLRITGITRETKDTITLSLESIQGKVSYEAGQFLTFIFGEGRQEIRRSYSFSSAPGIDSVPTVTIKRVANGEISRRLVDDIKRDDVLISLPPSGLFTIQTHAQWQRQIFFITAGSGITPVFSLLKKILKEEPLTRIFLIYQNRNEQSIIFKTQLHGLEKKYSKQFKWISLLSRPAKHPHTSHRLTSFLLEKIVSSHFSAGKETLFYLCGPPILMRMAAFTLKLMGFSDSQIRKENFTIEYIPPPPLVSDANPKQLTIRYHQQVYDITAEYPTNILQAALNHNIQLPYSCRGGRCATCVARLLKGKVKMSINEVLTEKDLLEGLVLTCVGYAETDVDLEF